MRENLLRILKKALYDCTKSSSRFGDMSRQALDPWAAPASMEFAHVIYNISHVPTFSLSHTTLPLLTLGTMLYVPPFIHHQYHEIHRERIRENNKMTSSKQQQHLLSIQKYNKRSGEVIEKRFLYDTQRGVAQGRTQGSRLRSKLR